MECTYKLCINKLTGKQTKFCSSICKSKYHVIANRRRTKIRAVQYKGGECEICGYNNCITALVFHHRDARSKDFGLGGDGTTRAWADVQRELDKCQLLCANCHAEIHSLVA